ncbi:hypothetical protein TOL_2843 [Thalassolituus oleivorans MIL-1]|uniref:Uncharacterized protein n=2 Tax=root TaxID=1 RepID=M5DUL0_9GAMM|nr:hypothetical protein TOL_2843 [Thalassolituus oleivorans MIL-1]
MDNSIHAEIVTTRDIVNEILAGLSELLHNAASYWGLGGIRVEYSGRVMTKE